MDDKDNTFSLATANRIFFPMYHSIEDDYGNEYRVWDKKTDGYWVGEIVNKRSGKTKTFTRKKKKAVWAILERHCAKKDKQFEESRK